MLELKFIRENPEIVREAVRKKRSNLPLDELLELDRAVMREKQEIQDLSTRRNALSKGFKDAGPEQREALRAESAKLGDEISRRELGLKELEERLHALELRVPNIPDPSVPEGDGEEDNVPIPHWGTPRQFDFTPLRH